MTSAHRKSGRDLFVHEELVWRHDEIPWNVVVAYGSEPLRRAYLPEDASWLEVENALHRCYRSHETGRGQETVTDDMQIIDQWRFTILPGALMHADQTASNWLTRQPWERVRAGERATGMVSESVNIELGVNNGAKIKRWK